MMSAKPSSQNRSPLGEQAIDDLVRGLDNLRWNLEVQIQIFALGAHAVPALVRFLQQPPGQFPDGRVLAAEALGRVGGEAAFQGLLCALNPARLRDLEPVVRLSEEAVQDAVARELGRMGDRRAVPFLIDSLRTSRLIGAAEALVRFHEATAIPWLIEGLDDAFKRDRFALAIQEMGRAAVPFLVETLARRCLRDGQELLPSLERRAKALEILAGFNAREAMTAMRTALEDPSSIVRTEAALAYVAVAESRDDVLEAVPALLAGLTHPDFMRRDRCAEAIIRIGLPCLPLLRQAIVQGGVMVRGEAVPLTLNGRQDLLRIIERLEDSVAR
ncbi:MAG: HEAT repeat domain-containing protein [Nitrospira sp.]|nr:HEAT repeat domain-containing protein [Nitrospira sp.]